MRAVNPAGTFQEEQDFMYRNLYLNGLGDLQPAKYWGSCEASGRPLPSFAGGGSASARLALPSTQPPRLDSGLARRQIRLKLSTPRATFDHRPNTSPQNQVDLIGPQRVGNHGRVAPTMAGALEVLPRCCIEPAFLTFRPHGAPFQRVLCTLPMYRALGDPVKPERPLPTSTGGGHWARWQGHGVRCHRPGANSARLS